MVAMDEDIIQDTWDILDDVAIALVDVPPVAKYVSWPDISPVEWVDSLAVFSDGCAEHLRGVQ